MLGYYREVEQGETVMVHELWVNGQLVKEFGSKPEAFQAFKAAKNVTEKSIKSYVRH